MTTLPITLAIDTAAPRLNLALLRADGGVDVLVEDIAKGHAEILFDRIGTLLERNGLGYVDVERVAVTTGPGSFTGLRIGLSAARGLGVARNIPVLGIPSLLAVSLGAATGPVAVLIDARRDEAYFELFPAPGVVGEGPMLVGMTSAREKIPEGVVLIESPFVDIGAMARFAAAADPQRFPPHASYVRDADAKPQDAARIPRRVP
ncbi:tRNA (adenosine(37)-N6)-threonylcarbamoyltransferase complex dimerization subunit type 1 TsaB [Devosia sediminis]|uniref:tRNA (Adenosine(37)-N6)-threonylcarbamoyltransferase complex dimerization subunit type 1 TsaB n=1 Tax=Devosia sediminis TaxID=2798801 RepID=A0A934J0L8_9HYPH|nr:tRNA (adenosine(37)-N6)-threonylcarbamoyltransferase complex dimerization subunit type 1 TsaB [Devosia sediminis]MBJ3785667.1 tRNA (adenosine(37)-N6)-threonylcarbamoyltransferase complex dimerization subunit type 1 TsaB [Devosia sediminis]